MKPNPQILQKNERMNLFLLFFYSSLQENKFRCSFFWRANLLSMLSDLYWVCDKMLVCLKKDPNSFKKCPEQFFLKQDIFFCWNFKKKIIRHKSNTQDDHTKHTINSLDWTQKKGPFQFCLPALLGIHRNSN